LIKTESHSQLLNDVLTYLIWPTALRADQTKATIPVGGTNVNGLIGVTKWNGLK
jgi:hypothetical protein